MTQTHFTVLGEEFPIEGFPHLYMMHQTSHENLERQLGSVARAWHEGSIASAGIAMESDMGHFFGTALKPAPKTAPKTLSKLKRLAVKTLEERQRNLGLEKIKKAALAVAYESAGLVPVPIPEPYRSQLPEEVVVARGPNNRVYIYTPDNLATLKQKIAENKKRHGLAYPEFHAFELAGFVDTSITQDGELLLPDFLVHYMGPTNAPIRFTTGELWLEARREHPDRCDCPEPTCAKCLGINCTNDNCSTHTMERKLAWRKRNQRH